MWHRRAIGSARHIPTDRDTLQAIYDRYQDSLTNFDRGLADRLTAIMVPIDCEAIAAQLNVHVNIVFGRLYYHLERKHGYTNPDGGHVSLFALVIGTDRYCVNLPLLAAVLAGLQEDAARSSRAFRVSMGSLAIAIAALIVSLLRWMQSP